MTGETSPGCRPGHPDGDRRVRRHRRPRRQRAVTGARFGCRWPGSSLVGVGRHLRVRGDVRAGRGDDRAGHRSTWSASDSGPRVGLANLVASFFVNVLTLTAEIAGVALALQLAAASTICSGFRCVGLAVWLVMWRVQIPILENGLRPAGPRPGGVRRRACGGCTRLVPAGAPASRSRTTQARRPRARTSTTRSRCSARR